MEKKEKKRTEEKKRKGGQNQLFFQDIKPNDLHRS